MHTIQAEVHAIDVWAVGNASEVLAEIRVEVCEGLVNEKDVRS